MSSKRISKMRVPVELRQLEKTQSGHGISCATKNNDDNYSELTAKVPGPQGSPFENIIFEVCIAIGDQYPFRPPAFKFITPVFHPNIDSSGNICLGLLRMPPTGSYNPAITLESMLLSIQLLLANPNPDDPLNGEAADLYKSYQSKYIEKVQEYHLQHAIAKEHSPAPPPAAETVEPKRLCLEQK